MSATRLLRVGTPWAGYNERRNFLDVPVPGVRFVRVRDRYAVLHALRMRFADRRDERLRFRHGPPSVPGVDLLHFFNTVSSGSTPWVVTFETSVPRRESSPEEARRLIESPSCRRLIAMSDCARTLQVERWQRVYGESAAVERKLEVLHPPQAPLVASVDEKPDPGRGLRFVFVGRHFFRKGGRPLLTAFDALLRDGADVHLHVVSSLEPGDRWSRSTPEDVAAARRVIAAHPERISWDASLPHGAVLDAMRRAHVVLLPTLVDTYGYSVLEGQAAACAALTTNVRALPEINPPATGWTIELPLGRRLGVELKRADQLRAAEEVVRHGLLAAVEEMLHAPDEVVRRGRAGLERVRREHDPARAAERLFGIYSGEVPGDA